jgi:uncharacterized membrane protein
MKVESRRMRLLRERLLKAGVWIFLVIFILSVLGVGVALMATR